MFKNHPKGLLILALSNMGERFGYYTMLAILTLYMQAKFGLSSATTSLIYGSFLALVYFLPLLGGIVADKILGYGKTILLGIGVMFFGYLLLAIPSESDMLGKVMMFSSLALIAIGTGFFKGNLQALVGNLYESDAYKGKRDVAFSIFYMFINIGAFFAPSAANTINNAVLQRDGFTYEASIPKSYVALNDKVLSYEEENKFLQDLFSESKPELKTAQDSNQFISKAKKKEGVIFQGDKQSALFKLKASGLAQLTEAGKITSPDQMLSKADFYLLESKKPADKEKVTAIKERINSIHITDNALFGDQTNQDAFALNFGKAYVEKSLSSSYNLAFGVACISLLLSVFIFMGFRRTWKGVDKTHKQQLAEAAKSGVTSDVAILSPAQVRERIIALLLVFFVVIFFWMSFHQNGLCMTFFARDYTNSEISPTMNLLFSLPSLLAFLCFAYGIYISTMGLFGGKRNPKTGLLITLVGLGALIAFYFSALNTASSGHSVIKITPQIFQQFNPLFIILLTPLAVGFFAFLANRKKEPSAPKKIGIGMLIAAVGFIVLFSAALFNQLPAPSEINGVSDVLVSPNWLIGTYFVLTIAELFLSPMGLSFVAKVAPPQYKGMMQGGWLAATAVGNYLVGVMGLFWEKLPMFIFWGVLVVCCLLSAMFIFSVLKRLEKATQ